MKDAQQPIEYVDLVNQFDHVIGSAPISEIHNSHNIHSRAVNIFIQNSIGELWIPRRSPCKSRWPSTLDFGVSGHVSSGESYIEAAIRETKEELLIDINPSEFQLLEKVSPYSHSWSPCFCSYYLLKCDEITVFNLSDFSEASWITPMKLHERLSSESEPQGKPALIHAVKYFFKL